MNLLANNSIIEHLGGMNNSCSEKNQPITLGVGREPEKPQFSLAGCVGNGNKAGGDTFVTQTRRAKRADEALYYSKQQGRNRVTCWEQGMKTIISGEQNPD